MEVFTPYLSQIRIPGKSDKVYKDECVFSFDNPETETGLYVSLSSFFGFGKEYVKDYFLKTGHGVFLHIRREKHEIPSTSQGDGPEKKITRLAIGVEGGFDPDSGRKFEYVDFFNVVVMPNFTTFSWPNTSLPEVVKQSVTAILEIQSAATLEELESLTGTWDGEARIITRHAENLPQLHNGKKIPPSGWRCEKCDKTENLWLNLTDGSILCGRRFYDGTGGNNHAVQHYSETLYPLAVKLGTITKDGKADIFSYTEDDLVEDPKLGEHLAHWGINIANMEKTEKSMIELELELNQKAEWFTLQESGGTLRPVNGPGYTGMANLGNSCYLNSVIQTMFIVPDFIRKYVENAGAFFEKSEDPPNDFNVQMAKIGTALWSGKYSQVAPDAEQPGISPVMFKTLVGRGHPDFSTKRQQDAQEFFLYMLTLLERHNHNQDNPGDAFKFKVEERVQCTASKKVKYSHRSDYCLSLNIPLEAVCNKEEVAAYEARKQETEAQGKKLDPEFIVRPKIKLFSCLEVFIQSEIVEQFFSTAVNGKTTARKTTRVATFPDYLVIQLKKFTLREDWVPIKLDVAVEMPDVLDLSALKAKGPQPDEEPLPELVGSPPLPVMDEAVLNELADMGFPPEACKRAVFFTQNSGLEAATAWIMEHITDSNFADPFIPPGTESAEFTPNPDAVPLIIGMGFTQDQAYKALKATNNNVERAVDWIFSHQDELANTSTAQPEFRDGDSKYKLVAFISHMGSSTMVGHYVVHILKDGRWVIFNDNKVALSEHPPKELGYLYLYERL
ncbi:ubiquitin carboxyl-terminal hydrolase [Holotrichia oblita]|uniref:Ubiquitin carboxyl-terminal hydrolase n=1 Tax=Holotrichia oblita TaxID=644536 RepID=A0ACB9TXN6_HOLOL|nr:ubiquitin carboxyl-terminal hydrolase [Holotrichia oblita]